MIQQVKWKWWAMLTWLGVCHQCYQVFSHDPEGPWADCKCGCTEWTSKPGLIPRFREWWHK